MRLKLSVLDGIPLSGQWIRMPFTPKPGFNEGWWLGEVRGPLVFYSFATDALGEVARARIKARSTFWVAYPTYTRPQFGSTEIDRFEVRYDLQSKGFGHDAIAQLLVKCSHPLTALSLGTRSDPFWRSLGWVEHTHPDGGASLFVQPR
jgi:hypothetical protein